MADYKFNLNDVFWDVAMEFNADIEISPLAKTFASYYTEMLGLAKKGLLKTLEFRKVNPTDAYYSIRIRTQATPEQVLIMRIVFNPDGSTSLSNFNISESWLLPDLLEIFEFNTLIGQMYNGLSLDVANITVL